MYLYGRLSVTRKIRRSEGFKKMTPPQTDAHATTTTNCRSKEVTLSVFASSLLSSVGPFQGHAGLSRSIVGLWTVEGQSLVFSFHGTDKFSSKLLQRGKARAHKFEVFHLFGVDSLVDHC